MTAPSVVLLGYGGEHPHVAGVSHGIRDGLLEIRPELDVHVSFLDSSPPSGLQLVSKLVKHGAGEIVFLPLVLSDAFEAPAVVPDLVAQIRAAHPRARVIASRPVGPEAQLLAVIDRRLREALRASRASELDGLVFAAAGSRDVRSNAIVARRARQWSSHHKLPCVTAFATGSGPTTAEAIRTLRGHGRRHIAVGSWFLTPGEPYDHQAELALSRGAVAVSAPMGPEPEVVQAVLARYLVAAMELVDLDESLEPQRPPVPHLAVVGA